MDYRTTDIYDLAHYWICQYIEAKRLKGFTNTDIKQDFGDAWNDVYKRAWRNIKASARKSGTGMFYKDGKYYY